MTYATVDDVRRRLGRPITDTNEIDQVNAWLEAALRFIRREFTRAGLDLDTQVALDDPDELTVIDVQAEVVVRRITTFDPEGLTSITKSVDDSSITKRREGRDTSSAGWFTEDDWATLLPLGKLHGNAFSIRPSYSPDTCDAGPWTR